jgi:ATP-dependent helicase HrpA
VPAGDRDEDVARFAEQYRWMIEDFKVSVFAPEVRVPKRISTKRLDEAWEEWAKKRRLP